MLIPVIHETIKQIFTISYAIIFYRRYNLYSRVNINFIAVNNFE